MSAAGLGIQSSARVTIHVDVQNQEAFTVFARNVRILQKQLKDMGGVDSVKGMISSFNAAGAAAKKSADTAASAAQKQIAADEKRAKVIESDALKEVQAERKRQIQMQKDVDLRNKASQQEIRADETATNKIIADEAKRQAAIAKEQAALAKAWENNKVGLNAQVAAFKKANVIEIASDESAIKQAERKIQIQGQLTAAMKKMTGNSSNNFKDMAAAIQRDLKSVDTNSENAVNHLEHVQNGINKMTDQLAIHSQKMKTDLRYRLDYYERQMDSIFRASFRLQMVGQNMQMFGQRIRQGFSEIMDTFGEFQFTMNRAAGTMEIFNQTGTATQVGIDQLQESLLQLSRTAILLPAGDVAKAMYFWASATGAVVKTTQDLNDQMTALEPIMKVAVMTDTSYETAIKGVYSIIQQYFNGAVSMSTKVVNELFYATQKTALEFPDLINSFKMIGPIAKANNVSFDEMVGLLGQIGDAGVRGTMAGRALRQMLIQITRPSGPAVKAMQALFARPDNIQTYGKKDFMQTIFPSGEFVGITKYINVLADATKNMGDAERNALLAHIATANELPVLTALIIRQQDAVAGLNDNLKDYKTTEQQATEFAQKNWELLQSSWKGIIGELQRAWEHFKIQLGSSISDVLQPFMHTLAGIIEQFRVWARNNPTFIQSLAKVAAIIGVIATVGGTIFTVIGSMMGLAAALYLAINAFRPWLGAITGAIGVTVAFATAIARNFGFIQANVQQAWDAINRAMSEGGKGLSVATDIVKTFTDVVSMMMDVVVRGLAVAINYFGQFVAVLIKIGNQTGVLKLVVASLAALVAARMIFGVLGLVEGMIGLSKAITIIQATTAATTGLRASVTALIRGIGPGGIFAIIFGVGYVAYENNLFGFKNMVDKLTSSFRDMGQEFKDVASGFGDQAVQVQNLATSLAKLQRQQKGMAVGQAGTGSIFSNEHGGYDPAISPTTQGQQMMGGAKWTYFIDGAQRYADTYEKAMADIKLATDTTGAEITKGWAAAVDEINASLIQIGKSPITTSDFATILEKLAGGVSTGTSYTNDYGTGSSAAMTAIAKTIEMSLAPGSSQEQIGKVYDDLKGKWEEALRIPREQFIKSFFSPAGFQTDAALKEAAQREVPWKTTIDKILALSAGDLNNLDIQKQVADLFMTPNFLKAEQQFTPAMKEQLGQVMGRLSGDLQDTIGSENVPVSKGDTLSSTLQMAMNNYLENIIGGAVDSVDFTSIIDKVSTDINISSPTNTSGLRDAWTRLVTNIVNPATGETALQMAQSGSMPATLSGEVISVVQWMAEILGKKDPTVTNMMNAAGVDVSALATKDFVDGMVAGFGSNKTTAKAIRDALKKGSDMKNIGRMMSNLFGRMEIRGLNAGDNAAARQLAEGQVQNVLASFEDAWMLKGPHGQKRLEAQFLKWTHTIPYKKMSPAERANIRKMIADVLTFFQTQTETQTTSGPTSAWGLGSIGSALGLGKVGPGKSVVDDAAKTIKSSTSVNRVSGAIDKLMVAATTAVNAPASVTTLAAIGAGKAIVDDLIGGASATQQALLNHFRTAYDGLITDMEREQNSLWNAGYDLGKSGRNGILAGFGTISLATDAANNGGGGGTYVEPNHSGGGGAFRSSGGAAVSQQHNLNRRVQIDINVKSGDGSVNRATLAQMRQATIDAIVASDVAHLAQVQ